MLGRYCSFSVTVLQILDTRIYLTKIFFECKKFYLQYLLCKNQSSRRFWSIVIFPSKSGAKNCMHKILEPVENELLQYKTNQMTLRPAKTQISLGICLVWSESSLCAQWVAKDPRFLHADTEDWSDWADAQADLSLRWEHSHFVGFVKRRLKSWGSRDKGERGRKIGNKTISFILLDSAE